MRRVLLCVVLIGLLAGVRHAGMVNAAAKDQQATGTKPSTAVDPANYVGSETCMTCHEDVGKNFATNPHSRLALLHGGKGATCESCHGPGKAHVESGGDAAKIFRFTKASAKADRCHLSRLPRWAHPDFERSPHAKANVGCTSCHSVHKCNRSHLLKVAQPSSASSATATRRGSSICLSITR